MTGKYLTTFQRKLLQKNLAKPADDLPDNLRKRIEIMLYADEGKSQTEICQILKCSPATARTWIFKAQSGMAHQWQEHPRGRPAVIQERHLERLKELVTISPRELGECFDEWTGYSLSRRLAREFGIKVSKNHINRLLKQYNLAPSNISDSEDRLPQHQIERRISIQDLPLNKFL
ncbi:MAG: helix-turn-helix domain-containing protein [Cyanosarcina radialis HA8281-LM2]|jgi:transposase|nr:helix-turn-helix domain-containing protein [Cyanosarcina radialis HA8281-LM2]